MCASKVTRCAGPAAYDFPAVSDGKLIKEFVEQRSPAPASGFAFNTRRKIFEDVRVREALVMAFDFEWANANLFGKAYKRTYGYFSGSALSSLRQACRCSANLPSSAPMACAPDYLDGSYQLPVSDGSGKDRKILRAAVGMLAEAGWTIKDGEMVNAAGEPFAFTLTIANSDQEKIALHYPAHIAADRHSTWMCG